MAKGGRSACGLLKRLFELFEGNDPEEEIHRLKSEDDGL
jgi:hypothetical protein